MVMEKSVANIKEIYHDKLLPYSNKLVKLELVIKNRGEHFLLSEQDVKCTPVAYDDIFTDQVTRKTRKVKRVLIEGGAGTGKTTFCISISKSWANGEVFQEYELLLFLPLHEEKLASVGSLSGLIKSAFKLKVNSQAVATCLQQNNGQGVLLVADGWNELHESKRRDGSFLHNLLFGETLSLASVIVTSRPSASASLHRTTLVDRFIEMRGFSTESVKQYVQYEFSGDQKLSDTVLEQMDHNPLIQSICSNPICCTSVCHLCHTSDKDLTSTVTNLCTKIVLKILCHNVGKTDTSSTTISNLSEIDTLPKSIRDSWWRLCKLAFQSIDKSQIDLSQIYPFQYGIEVIGLVEYIPEESGTASLQFLHPSFRGYLAALHLIRQPVNIQLKRLDTIKFQHFWRSLFGLFSASEDNGTLVHAVQTLKIDDYSKCLLSQCAFEATNPNVTREVIKSLIAEIRSKTITHFGDPQNPYDCDAILYVIENMQGSECDGMVVNFKACSLNVKQITKLTDILSTMSGKLQIKDLDLSDNSLSDGSITDLFYRAKGSFRSLEKLFVQNNNIEEEGLCAIMDALSSKKATQLDLSFNRLTKTGLQVLQDGIKCDNLTNLEILFMQGSLSTDGMYNIQYLSTLAEALLTHCPHLRRLDLSGNDFGEPGTPTISRICMKLGKKIDLRLNREYMSEVDKNFIAIMEDSIRRKGTIDHTVVHGVFVGPGRSGKNSLMNRLMGEAPLDPDSISPSTGVLENVFKVEVKKLCTVAAAVNNLVWRKLDYDEEALEIMMTTAKSHTASAIAIDHKATSEDSTIKCKEGIVGSAIILVENESTRVVPNPPPISNEILEVAKGSVVQISGSEGVARESFVATSVDVHSKEGPLEIFKRAVKLRRMDALREHLESSWSLYLTNTGGQTEFQELLPILVCGPSVFFITFPLNKNLHEHYTVQYQYPDRSVKTYPSSSTLMDEILQTLATIDALDCAGPWNDVKQRPIVYFIGTHKDRLPQSCVNDAIQKIDEELKEKVLQTSLFHQGSIEFAVGTEQLIFTVNNFDKADTDFQKIRLALQQAVERCEEFTITCPSTWLIFSLILRAKHKSNQVLSYSDCFTIAQRCGISDRAELNDALFFIHTRLGLVRYFCVKELNKLVVIDPQILFDTITKLIVKTFVSDHAKVNEIVEFQKKGIFSMEVIERISKKNEFKSQLSYKWLLELLNHLRIAAFFKKGGEPFCFFPSVLCHAPEQQLKHTTSVSHEPPPLLIAFESGFCPRGIPGALIKYLMTNEMKSHIIWELHSSRVFKNQVSFSVGPGDIILKILPTHLQVSFDPESEIAELSDVKTTCQEAYTQFQQAMNTVTKGYRECNYYFAFYCTKSSCKDYPHPAEIDCNKMKLKCKIQERKTPLPRQYELWKLQIEAQEQGIIVKT